MEYEHIVHSFEPVYDKDSEILILGTLPSVKSRENNFYYGHKQNRFWKVLATLLKEPVPETIEEKKAMLLAHRIALWDVIQSCDIKGSSDSSIKNVQPTDSFIKGTSFRLLESKRQCFRPQAPPMPHGRLRGCVRHGRRFFMTCSKEW